MLQMSALFNFQSLLTVLLLCICTCAYIRSFWPSILDRSSGHLATWQHTSSGHLATHVI